MARVPNWGPSAGQPVPDEQWAAYTAANPPPEGASFVAGPAASSTLGPYAGDEAAAARGVSGANQDQFWSNYFAQGAKAPPRAGVPFESLIPGSGKRTASEQARRWQQQLMQDLQRQAAGDPNSRAQQGLTSAYGQARAGQSALGSATRGTGGAAGLRQGVQGAGNVQRSYAGDQQLLMTQEKQAAQALLAQQLAQMRGQDARQAGMMAQNALGNQSLEDAMRQFYTSGGIQTDVAANQLAADLGRARVGLDLEAQAAQTEANNRWMQAGATAAGVAGRYAGSGGRSSSGYRQIDGQNSIVPEWDK